MDVKMYIVLYFGILMLKFIFSHAVNLNVTLQDEHQSFTVYEDDYPIVLKIYDNHDEIFSNNCNGSCSVKNWTLGSTCNLPDHRYMNVLMDGKAKMTYNGRWKCSYMARDILYNVTFILNVKEIVLSMLPKEIIPPVLTKLPHKHLDTGYNINAMEGKNNITLNEGDQVVTLNITGIANEIRSGYCEKGSCTIIKTKQEIPTSKCTNVENILNVQLTSIKVTQSYAGTWECSFSLLQMNANTELKQVQIPIRVSVKSTTTEAVEKWIFIGAGLAVLGLIIIVQTVCILYFKAKAKKAEMVKNLTPTKTSSEPDMRYVKNQKGSDEAVRESGIYEALETVTGRAPIPPPIETLPVTPNPLSRSVSTQHLSAKKPEPWQSRTNTRPNHKKTNPVDNLKTLERIKNRPQFPLPTPEEIYEVMTPETSPKPTKGSSRFNKNKAEQSPLLARQQMPQLFGKSLPIAPVQNQRVPNVSTLGRKPPLGPPGTGPASTASGPNSTLKMPAPFGHPLQGNMVRPPFGPGGQLPRPSGRAPAGAMPVMGAMPVLPSMISASKLKPVKQSSGTPTGNPLKNTSAGFRMPPANGPRVTPGGPRMPGESPRMTPGIGPRTLGDNCRMTPAQPNNIAKLGPVPSFKPKPPIPLPESNEMEPSQDPESYYGSSDEEFDCYDVLPEYRIYGNAPPKKIN